MKNFNVSFLFYLKIINYTYYIRREKIYTIFNMPPTDYKQYYIDHKEIMITRAKNRYIEHKDDINRSCKNRYQEKKQDCIDYQRRRYEEKKKEILRKKKIKITCDCGSSFCKNQKQRHIRTKKHIRYLQSLALTMNVILVDEIDQIE